MKKIISVLLICFMCISAGAQDTVYFGKNNSHGNGKKKQHSAELNIIKISPLSFISGFIPVYYERELTPFFSIQVGAGVTTRNYMRGWINTLDEGEEAKGTTTWNAPGNEGNYNQSNPFEFSNRKANIGYCFSIQPRIFFESEGLEGSFLGISYDYYHYSTSAKKIATGPGNINGEPVFTNKMFKEYEKFADISAYFGSQTLYDRIALEYSIGLGLRNVKSKHYAYTTDYNSGEYIDGELNNKQTKLAFNLAIKVGYHF